MYAATSSLLCILYRIQSTVQSSIDTSTGLGVLTSGSGGSLCRQSQVTCAPLGGSFTNSARMLGSAAKAAKTLRQRCAYAPPRCEDCPCERIYELKVRKACGKCGDALGWSSPSCDKNTERKTVLPLRSSNNGKSTTALTSGLADCHSTDA